MSLTKDKKNTGDKISAILTRGPGKMFKERLALDNKFRDNLFCYFKTKAKTENP